ncbi:two-component system, OmpR family, osmolarity sensor histidine kinase EnvZ (plasmid) [Ketogulonicigenium robustum]|uniref:histidine kinase n=1 Tax=Ketogulonicigenium robustum TaxID=92947 RepID=A0A1W6P339_9RHOB|nr:ATP-binding protein [Ketogulonicigenium robustum]ARO15864.1 two-component system, OmpR family, osmolarity sensor histidine kinase EnvZ [Ketogulonicigenium robustum]
MISLRLRISLVLIGSILAVVILSTAAVLHVMFPRYVGGTIAPIVRQLEALATLAETDPGAARVAGATFMDHPFAGETNRDVQGQMEGLFVKATPQHDFTVTRGPGAPHLTASLLLDTGTWMVVDIPDFSGPDDHFAYLAMWVGLITLGTAGMALYLASGISRPLTVVEKAMQRIGPDGVIPHVQEKGPPEIRQMAHTLNQLSLRLRQSMESRMRLIAAAGHDLRTPLTRMRLRAEFIADPEEQAKWLSDLEEMDAIADSAISLVREEVGQHTAETIDLRNALHDVLADMGDDVTLGQMPQQPVFVRVEPIGLKRALRNLIHNAAIHGGGTSVALQLDTTPTGDMARVIIRDQGPGIPAELLERVFEPFFRVDMARRKSVPGVGLGLAIAKEIVERFEGNIAIRNLSPNGLEQIIALPVALKAAG